MMIIRNALRGTLEVLRLPAAVLAVLLANLLVPGRAALRIQPVPLTVKLP